jgi:hypothetical protein
MERLQWTDERLDERMAAIDDRFVRHFEELRTLPQEMRAGFAGIRDELKGIHAEMGDLRRDVHADHVALQRHLLSLIAGQAIALLGLFGAFVAAQL